MHYRFTLFIVGLLVAWGAPAAADVSPERLALLAKGINLNAGFTPWAPPADSSSAFHADEAAFLKKAGFSVVRLPLAADFISGAESSLELPVESWQKLWTRDEGAGQANLGGPGQLSLTLVARDAAGQVINWSFAAVRVVAGASEPATSFTVPTGVATLEPRWSGSGPSSFRVGAFRLVRNGAASR